MNVENYSRGFLRYLLFVSTLFYCTFLSGDEVEQVPSFCLKSMDNEMVSIDSLRGKYVVIDFWAIYCTSCVDGLDAMKDIFAEYKDTDLEFLAISEDGPRNKSKVPGFVKGHQWEYMILYDTNQEVKNLFGIQAIPEMYIINPEGNIIYRHRGYKEGDEKDFKEKLEEFLPEPEGNGE
jgi:peroxiredoxin